jgi:hypothetical protein
METIAVLQAKMRLAKAEKALGALKAATKIEEAEEAWTDFLLAAATIYSKLQQGSKGNTKSQLWFTGKKRERKDDPLLRYLHFARNSDEHGIERVAEVTPSNAFFGRKLGFNERVPVQFQKLDPTTNQPEDQIHDGVFAGPTLKPIRAHDRRFGDYCDPPEKHRGEDILFANFVDGIATAALPYLRELVAEAETLVSDRSSAIAK